MITEKEFEERFGFKPQQDDLHRVNCNRAGEVGHLMCGVCSQCGQPRFICGEECYRLRQLGLVRIGDELFALPAEDDRYPVILVFKPADLLRLGFNADPSTPYFVRERALSDDAYRLILDDRYYDNQSGLNDCLFQLLNDETIHMIHAVIRNRIKEELLKGDLFKDPGGVWRHACEYWFGERQSRDLDRENW